MSLKVILASADQNLVAGNCEICKKAVDNTDTGICCSACDKWYHVSCKNITKNGFRNLMKQPNWFCSDNCNLKPSVVQCVDPENLSNKEIMLAIQGIIAAQTEMTRVQSQLQSYCTAIQEKVDTIQSTVTTQGKSIINLSSEILRVEQKVNNSNYELQGKVNKLEQANLNTCIVVTGKMIPTQNPTELISKLSNDLKSPRLMDSVTECVIMKSKKREQLLKNENTGNSTIYTSVVVKFSNREACGKFIQKTANLL